MIGSCHQGSDIVDTDRQVGHTGSPENSFTSIEAAMTSPDKPPVDSQPQQLQHYPGREPSAWESHHQLPPQYNAPNPASSPVPPGFRGGQPGVKAASGGSSSMPGSQAPPGFVSDSNSRGRLPPSSKNMLHGQAPSALSAEMAQASGGRTSSFVNLAAVFGTGLAESMDDATKGDGSGWNQHVHSNPEDLSLHRQSRHAAARLIGSSPPGHGHGVENALGLDMGLFGTTSGGPPAHLGPVNLPATKAQSQSQQPVRGGFLPTSILEEGPADQRRDYSPLSMFGPNPNRRGQPPMSKDIGVTVMEPSCMNPGCGEVGLDGRAGTEKPYNEDSGGVLAALMQEQQGYGHDPCCRQQHNQQPQQHLYEQPPPARSNADRDTYEVERGMRDLWVDDSASLGAGSRQSRNRRQQQQQPQYGDRSVASTRSGGSQNSRLIAEAEIRPFLWDPRIPQQQQYQRQQQGSVPEVSRCLAILKAAHLQIPQVRSKCEAFGVLETFRSDFADRGIIFVSYYDIRSAQYAALDLEGVLKRCDNNEESGQDVAVYYCVPLNSSTQTDESRLVLADVPPYVDEHSLLSMLSSYGAVRSLRRQGGYYGGSSFEVEFHNTQDAKQALLELSSTQPWGPDVAVEVCMRPPIDRKRGRELLAVIGRWRHGAKANHSPTASTARTFEPPARLGAGPGYYRGAESSASSSPALAAPADTTTQLVLGPDGRYSYVIVNNQSGYPQPPSSDYNSPYHRRHHQDDHHEQPRQQIVHGPNGEIYITTVAIPSHQVPLPAPHSSYRNAGGRSSRDYWQPTSHSSNQYSNPPYHDGRERLDRISSPYYSQGINSHSDNRHGGHHQHQHHHNPHHPHSSNASTTSVGDGEKDNKHLVLDLENVENGRDARTSLMVRNIPNKYTQQMLLAEFTENGLGPGVIDFFYLPIDFKNRCNRGYAFINFVDFKDILPFHRRYFGKHWSTFNSDKICDITYARIQGKAAMLKRFENSALMEKDEEYKPLVFISHGPEKGKRIPFPEAAAASSGKP